MDISTCFQYRAREGRVGGVSLFFVCYGIDGHNVSKFRQYLYSQRRKKLVLSDRKFRKTLIIRAIGDF